MSNENMYRGWASYLFSGSIAVIVSWVIAVTFSGCRIGNHISDQSQTPTVSGFYYTQPQSYELFSTVSSQTKQASANPSSLPSLVSSILSNPVAFWIEDGTTDQLQIFNPLGKTFFPATLGTDQKTFSLNGAYPAQAAWTDPACTLQDFVQMTGTVNALGNSDSPTFTLGDGLYAVKGRLGIDIQVTHRFDGDCAASLQAIQTCYNDVSQCAGGDSHANEVNQAFFTDIYEAPIHAGIMSISDIANVSSVAYEIVYQ